MMMKADSAELEAALREATEALLHAADILDEDSADEEVRFVRRAASSAIARARKALGVAPWEAVTARR